MKAAPLSLSVLSPVGRNLLLHLLSSTIRLLRHLTFHIAQTMVHFAGQIAVLLLFVFVDLYSTLTINLYQCHYCCYCYCCYLYFTKMLS